MKTDLIYGVEDRPPFKDALFDALLPSLHRHLSLRVL